MSYLTESTKTNESLGFYQESEDATAEIEIIEEFPGEGSPAEERNKQNRPFFLCFVLSAGALLLAILVLCVVGLLWMRDGLPSSETVVHASHVILPNGEGNYCISDALANQIQIEVLLEGKDVVLQGGEEEEASQSNAVSRTHRALHEHLLAEGAKPSPSGGVCYRVSDPAILCIEPNDVCSGALLASEDADDGGARRELQVAPLLVFLCFPFGPSQPLQCSIVLGV